MQAVPSPQHAPRCRLRILYVGNLMPGGTCAQRRRAFEEIGCWVTSVNLASQAGRQRARTLRERVRRRLFGPRDWSGANQQVGEHVRRQRFDVLWIDRGLTIEADTLRAVRALQPHCRVIGYSPDDMHARHNQSPQFRRHLRFYDLYITTKSYGVAELKAMGCADVVFSGNAFDRHTHRPLLVSADDRERYGGLVGFVGTWEKERAESMYRLACSGMPVRVWGSMWDAQRGTHPNLRLEKRTLFGDAYALAINAFDINLCFLRRLNRDRQTTRSVEIPACGAFMLAERTDEHLALFKEGREAEFFSSDEELLEKVQYYLAHADHRRQIAAAGRERCLRDGYSYHERLAEILDAAGLDWRPVGAELSFPGSSSTGPRSSGCDERP